MAAPGGGDRVGEPVKGMTPEELGRWFAAAGEHAYRGPQLFSWLHGHGARSFQEITVFPLALRQRLEATADPGVFDVLARQADPLDGTVKYLFRLADGETVETVVMRYRYGLTACISSQVGCRMGCRFCASTAGGLVRNLTAAEMVEQLVACNRELASSGSPAAEGRRVARLVVMGMGEPLENLDTVLRFLDLAHRPEGCAIGWRHMTVSTSGLVPAMDELAARRLPITLAVSLHAPTDELRSHLMPINRRHPLPELLAACRRYVERTGRRLTFEYAMIDGVNDSPEMARTLAHLVSGLLCHVNLIPLNPVEGRGLDCSPPEVIRTFQRVLQDAGVPATVRRQLGTGIEAACGQLRRLAMRGQ
jgi:23S rRNA (adenine2503-C2)-methyltransferase